MDSPNAHAQEGASPRPRFSFSIDSLLSGCTSSSTSSTSAHTNPIITSSVSQLQGHYYSATGGQGIPTSPVPTQGAFHHHLPMGVPKCRSLPQKRPRQEDSHITPSSSPVSSPVSSARPRSPRLEDGEHCSKRTHLEEPARELCGSPALEEEGDDHGEQRDTDSPTDGSSGSGSPSSDTSSGVRRKKNRTSFTSEQISKLERHFLHHRYLAAPERTRLSRRLDLSEQQIKTWFQNRRMKEKRQVKDGDQPTPLLMTPPTGVLTTPTSLMMSQMGTPIMTSQSMTSQSMAAPSSGVSFSAMLASGSPPMMHHSPMSGHMMSHEMFPQGGHYPGFPAPHHILPGALPLGGMAHPHHYSGRAEYSAMAQYAHSMAMPVMMQ